MVENAAPGVTWNICLLLPNQGRAQGSGKLSSRSLCEWAAPQYGVGRPMASGIAPIMPSSCTETYNKKEDVCFSVFWPIPPWNGAVCRALLDAQLEEVFGTSDLNSGKILTLTEFLHCLHASQVKQLLNRVTAKTYKAPPPVTKRRWCLAFRICRPYSLR